MNAPARVDPGMCNGTCRATASTHAKDGTTVRTTTGQTSHGQHAGPVRAGGANLIPLEPEGVHAQQGMGIVDAVPIPDEMLQRGGEAQPSPFLGMKRRGARQSVAVGFGQDAFARHHANRPAQMRFSHLLKHAFHGGCFDAQGPRMLQRDAFDAGFLKPRNRQKKEQWRCGERHGTARHRVHQPSHGSAKTANGLRLWATGIGASFKSDRDDFNPCTQPRPRP